jgi:hypothetical protein
MSGFDDRHAAPPTVGPSSGRRVAAPPYKISGLTRRPEPGNCYPTKPACASRR